MTRMTQIRFVFIRVHLRQRLLPDTRNDCGAVWTMTVRRDVHLPDQVSETLYEQLIARRAPGILPATNSPRKISRVDVVQPRLTTNLTRADQLLRGRV